MAGGQERILRRRIRSVQSTKKITRAMELIAASRIVRAQNAINAARPYVKQMGQVVADLAGAPDARRHPMFREPEEIRRVAIITVTADRGLAGGYNSSVIRATERLVRQHAAAGREVMLITVGRKAQSYFRYRGQAIAEAFTGVSDRPSFADARRIVGTVMEPFAEGEVDLVQIVYTRFNSMASQAVATRQLVPLAGDDATEAGTAGAGAGAAGEGGGAPEGPASDYEFEPDPGDILDRLIPSWLQAQVLAALLDAAASEHAARQRAMKAATDNADELIKSLTRVMNRARQDAITTEIMEIVGGAEALRQSAGGGHGSFRPEVMSADAGTAQSA